jgi:Leucine-rich repeat (LRR) protein
MSIFLSGNNVASQPYIVKTNNNSKPPTNLSLPIGVDYLLPENGGAAIGSIKNVGNGNSSSDAVLYVVLAGENDLTNQVTYTLTPGQTLDVQIRYISLASTYNNGDPITMVDYDGVLAMSVSLSSTSTISMPYYNFSAKADWYQVFGGNKPSISEFSNWLDNQGFSGTYTVNGWTYTESTVISNWGSPIGEISCDLTIDIDKEFAFNNFFYEINGVGNLVQVGALLFQNNDYLTYINSYYPIYSNKNLTFIDNHTLSVIGGEIVNNRYTNFSIVNCYNFREIQNFTQFSKEMGSFNFRNNCNGGYPHDYLSTPIEFNYQMNNCNALGDINIVNNYITGIDWSIIESCDSLTYLYINNNMLNTFNPESLPNNIQQIDLSFNSLFEFKPKELPSTLTTLLLNNNQLPEFNLEFDFPSTCPNLSSLQLTYNYLSKWNQGLPSSISGLILDNNQLLSFDGSSLTSSISYISLQNNPLQSFPTGISQLTSLGGLFLQNTNMTNCNVNTAGLVSLTYLDLSYSNIVNLNIEDAGSIVTLNASYNKLKKLTFSNVSTSINSLDISNNPIVSFDADLKTYTPNLNNLSTNNLTSITRWTASIPDNITYLYVYNTLLNYFSPLGGINKLNQLALSDNQLSSFDVDLTGNIYLQGLSLADNLFTKWNQSIGNAMVNFQFWGNPLLKTFASNVPSTLATFDFYGSSLNSVLLTGTKIPNNFYLINNKMTTASWNAMNPWALTLTPGSGNFYASGNINTITGTTLQTTLVSKGVTVHA